MATGNGNLGGHKPARSRYANVPVHANSRPSAKGGKGSQSTSGRSNAAPKARKAAPRTMQRKRVATPSNTTRAAASSRSSVKRPSTANSRLTAPHQKAPKQAPRKKQGAISALIAQKRPVFVAIIALLAAICLIGVIDLVSNGNKIYRGVSVGDVDVSGMTREEAAASIDARYGSLVSGADVRIYADEDTKQKALSGQTVEDSQNSEDVSADDAAKNRKVWTSTASELEAHLDTAALAEQAYEVGRADGGLGARLASQTFSVTIEPTVSMNDEAIENLAYSIDRAIGNEHVDYGVSIESGVATVTDGHDGIEVNRTTLAQEIGKQMLQLDYTDGIVAHTEEVTAHITKEQAQETADFINASISQGATFMLGDTNWEAGTADLGALIVTEEKSTDDGGWELAVSYDEALTKNALVTHLQSAINNKNLDVEFVNTNGEITVKTALAGTMPDTVQALSALTQQTLEATPEATPVIQVAETEIPTSMSVDEALDYGLISTISSYETEYTAGAYNRNTNIHLAADLLNNSIIKANGGTWSFNDIAGECNEEKGFLGAGSIVDGQVTDEVGGGICQVATTVFNAVYEAGYPVDERTNHSLYMASYPAGRDAAVSWPDLDLAWHNDTSNDILMQTSWTETTVTVTLIGVDPGYVVESETGEFKDGAKYSTRTVEDDSLAQGETEVTQAGANGSSIEVTRTVKDSSGNIVRKDTFESVYDAQDEIISVGPGTKVSSSTDSDSDGSDSDLSDETDDESSY